MRVLITGGSGFIGETTCEVLLDNGYEVSVLDIREPSETICDRIRFIQGDVTNLNDCMSATQNVDSVVHLAAMSRSGPSVNEWESCINININGTANLLKSALKNNITKFVYAGSATYYGNRTGIQRVGDAPDLLNFYGLSKYAGEELVRQFQLHFGLNTTVLRYFNVYGPGQPEVGAYGLVMGIFARAVKLREEVEVHGDGRQRRDFIHVKDVARANLAAIKSPSSGKTYNVGSGLNVSIIELVELFGLKHRYTEKRFGDALETLADISETKSDLGWFPEIDISQGVSTLLK